MDQLRYQNIAALTQSIKAHNNLVKFTQLLVSVSVCSYIFSPSSLFIFLHYFKFYFSTFPFQLFTHNIDKNSMFLLCNGLLVFVGITRSFSSGSSGDNSNNEPSNNKHVGDDEPSNYVVDEDVSSQSRQILDVEAIKPMLEKTIELVGEQNIIAAEEAIEIKYCADEEVEEAEKIEKIILVDEEEQEKESSQSILEQEEEKEPDEENGLLDSEDEIEEEESDMDYFMIEENMEEEVEVEVEEDDDDDVEEEEEENCISTEELNKKFDDFIRRMKEDLRIEAKRQLVMV
ncbi:hypothetical protein RIF29_18103 [Crotalaria pallida]|uniref:Uncharacterized protein n=1 Tax=Crotalaria pallida TaxID=3830 RepID=A0AAN9IFX6_CROPI